MSRENTDDGAMLPEFQDFSQTSFPITGPCFSSSKGCFSKSAKNNSVLIADDFGDEVYS